MSEGDFEVFPRGTTEELRVLRKFANSMIALNSISRSCNEMSRIF